MSKVSIRKRVGKNNVSTRTLAGWHLARVCVGGFVHVGRVVLLQLDCNERDCSQVGLYIRCKLGTSLLAGCKESPPMTHGRRSVSLWHVESYYRRGSVGFMTPWWHRDNYYPLLRELHREFAQPLESVRETCRVVRTVAVQAVVKTQRTTRSASTSLKSTRASSAGPALSAVRRFNST